MKTATIDQIIQKAKECAANKKKWHFHILTPECLLNDQDDFALVMENTTDQECFVCRSNEPFMNVGKELVQLLHKSVVLGESHERKAKSLVSEQVPKILSRAKELNTVGIAWHHHMLFPDCQYNQHKGQWTILFEDKQKVETIESITNEEPKDDLPYIEELFYQQKKAG